jgi:hypothetical protein
MCLGPPGGRVGGPLSLAVGFAAAPPEPRRTTSAGNGR